MSRSKPGRDFEVAVYAFLKALSPDARVFFDHELRERDTASARSFRADAWIEARIGGHLPVTVLVSCKDYKRAVDIGHMRTFVGEVGSVGASTGVIYSRNGFTAAAIEKAERHGLSCCQLFEGVPPSVPEQLLFPHSYLCRSNLRLHLIDRNSVSEIGKWGQLFDLRIGPAGPSCTVADVLTDSYAALEEAAVGDNRRVPRNAERDIRVTLCDAAGTEVRLRLELSWVVYQARVTAHMLNGSYCVQASHFVGTQFGPSIDMHSIHPGPGWERLESPEQAPKPSILIVLRRRDFRQALLSLRSQLL